MIKMILKYKNNIRAIVFMFILPLASLIAIIINLYCEQSHSVLTQEKECHVDTPDIFDWEQLKNSPFKLIKCRIPIFPVNGGRLQSEILAERILKEKDNSPIVASTVTVFNYNYIKGYIECLQANTAKYNKDGSWTLKGKVTIRRRKMINGKGDDDRKRNKADS